MAPETFTYVRPIIPICSKFNVTKREHRERNVLSQSSFKFTSLQQVTQHNRHTEQGVYSAGKICLVSILIRIILTNPELQNLYKYLTNKIQQDKIVYQNFISYLYEAQHISGDTPPIIRSLKLH